eukprot:14604753-Alexandrium_andersonii.AAC.1
MCIRDSVSRHAQASLRGPCGARRALSFATALPPTGYGESSRPTGVARGLTHGPFGVRRPPPTEA